ncbi:hypothetical protein AVEN_15335-1 [Araneus ventricosus]|uniref:Uncharacterized protein n=1 Tax=Araneus ventricosus TaxID=182803 RepID=A0A4Y2MAM3_ARAVE|nr:hypothetical protein AVEN_15335-1 [Araneus ventricosus]
MKLPTFKKALVIQSYRLRQCDGGNPFFMVLVLLNGLSCSSDEIQITVYLDDNTEDETNTEYGQNSKMGIIVATLRGQQRHRHRHNAYFDLTLRQIEISVGISASLANAFRKSPSSLRVRNSTD